MTEVQTDKSQLSGVLQTFIDGCVIDAGAQNTILAHKLESRIANVCIDLQCAKEMLPTQLRELWVKVVNDQDTQDADTTYDLLDLVNLVDGMLA